MGFDPIVHRVGDREHALLRLGEHLELHRRAAVGKKDKRSLGEAGGQVGIEGAENVEVDLKRFGGVHIPLILAAPAEGFAAVLDDQAGGVHSARFKQGAMGGRKVFADDADESNRGK